MEPIAVQKPRRASLSLSLFICAALCAALLSSACVRDDLFVDLRQRTMVSLSFDPLSGEFSAPQLVKIDIGLSYRDWTIRYTDDPEAGYSDTGKWKDYDPDAGLILYKTVTLRAVAFSSADAVSGEASGTFSFTDARPQVFVDAAAVAGGNGLSPASPLSSIQAGIDAAAQMFDGTTQALVLVKSGTYAENLTMKSGVLLRGSYQDDWLPASVDTGKPNSFFYPTTYIKPSAQSNETAGADESSSLPGYCLGFPTQVTAASGVEFCDITGPAGGTRSAAVFVSAPASGQGSAKVSLRQCLLQGGDGAKTAAGVWLVGGGAAIDRCRILGRSGSLSGNSYGAFSASSCLSVSHSWVESGQGTWDPSGMTLNDIGVYSRDAPAGSGLLLTNNFQINASGGWGTSLSAGVLVSGGSAAIDNTASIMGGPAKIGGGMSVSTAAYAPSWTPNAEMALSAGVLAYRCAGLEMSGNHVSSGNADRGAFSGVSISAGLIADGGGAPGSALDLSVNDNARIMADLGSGPDVSCGILAAGNIGAVSICRNGLIQAGSGDIPVGCALLPAAFASPTIVGENGIFGGNSDSSGFSCGLRLNPSGSAEQPVIVRNNVIHGGSGGSGGSIGIYIDNLLGASTQGRAWLISNTVWSGSASGAMSGIAINAPSRFNAIDNIVDAGQYPLVAPDAALPDRLQNNCLHSDSTASSIFSDASGTVSFSDASLNGLAGYVWSGNVVASPRAGYRGFGAYPADADGFLSFDFRLQNGASLRAQGFDLSSEPAPIGFASDASGAARPTIWSIGAYE